MSTIRSTSRKAPATRRRALALRRCVLVLVAHAAARGAAGREPVRQWARLLARRRRFAAVRIGMVKGTPPLARAVAAGRGKPVLVVPFFLADGHFVRRVVPAVLERAAGKTRTVLCPPVGTSPLLGPLVAERAEAVCRSKGLRAAETALLLVGHGTRREAASGAAGRALAGAIAAQGRFAGVGCAFLEEPPSVAEALALLPGKAVVALGLFTADGMHGAGDVHTLLAAAQTERPVHYAGVIGALPGMVEAIVERAEAGARRCPRLRH